MARCAPMLRKLGKCSANCAPRRKGWRITPASEKESLESLSSARRAGKDGASRQSVGLMHQEGSAIGALRIFI
ncbi:hypothetical protein A2U01_0087637, partial [Trifolium medium]|nr:hypothetical protein [Trifolium medium]